MRYIQIVPEITKLPDMEKTFDEAQKNSAGITKTELEENGWLKM